MTRIALLMATLLASPVHAGEPDEATKKAALMLAYSLNGNSMKRDLSLGSIDLSMPLPNSVRTIPITPDKKKKDK